MAHTTLSIDKETYKKTSIKAKKDYLSVSAVATMLLNAYANGLIKIGPMMMDEPVELRELSDDEITPEIKRAANEAYNTPEEDLINIPV